MLSWDKIKLEPEITGKKIDTVTLLKGRNGNSIKESLDSLVKAIGKVVTAFNQAYGCHISGPILSHQRVAPHQGIQPEENTGTSVGYIGWEPSEQCLQNREKELCEAIISSREGGNIPSYNAKHLLSCSNFPGTEMGWGKRAWTDNRNIQK